MRVCPQCHSRFEDDMNFCLNDGSPLTPSSQRDVPTENYPGLAVHKPDAQPQPTTEYNPSPSQYIEARTIAEHAPTVDKSLSGPAKSNSYVWIIVAIGLLGLVAVGAGLAGALYFLRSRNTEVAVANNNTTRTSDANSENAISNLSTVNTDTSRNNNSTFPANITSVPSPNSNTAANRKVPPTPKPTTQTGEVATPVATPERSTPKTVAGGVLNGKAISLPKPAYPPAARAVRASGVVQVQVLIDETGRVISASAASGHPLLQAAAVAAARGARFSPTLLSGQPVKVSGIITYNFVL